ncbi:LacI family DNA-binding transcriptional regulator [Pseudonocardia sp. CA-107938]|uniref:LacI family DNA-binding transcriptional regulator n=1 Tax=Pseudonocardia sp. CA-107938 TaxID=3240021 RepID=UPI003D8DC211
MRGKPSLKTVAAAAGVSVSSVSNAYNRPGQLSDEVRERILRIASEQGYGGPDTAARTLRGKRAGAIGVLVTEGLTYAFSDPYTVRMLAGLAEVAEQSQTAITVIPIASTKGRDGDGAAAIEQSVLAVQQAVVDGILIYCVDTDHPAREVLRRRDLPVVTNFDLGEPDHGMVLIDEAAAAEPVGRLIRDLGHRNVAVLVETPSRPGAGPEIVPPERVPEQLNLLELQRISGFSRGLGTDVRATTIASGGNTDELGYAAANLALDLDPRPTAILTIADVQGIAAVRAIRDRGLEPGVDVSVTGFDDIPEAAAAGLTTVHQPIHERGHVLGRMLLDPEFTERRVVLPTELVVRTSTGPVSSS